MGHLSPRHTALATGLALCFSPGCKPQERQTQTTDAAQPLTQLVVPTLPRAEVVAEKSPKASNELRKASANAKDATLAGQPDAIGVPARLVSSNVLQTTVALLPETKQQLQVRLPTTESIPRRWPPVFSPSTNDVLTLRGASSSLFLGDSLAVLPARKPGGKTVIAVGTPGLSNPVRNLNTSGGVVMFELDRNASQLNRVGYLDWPKSAARFGKTVANVGDVDGDGNEDLAVGAPYHRPDGFASGCWALVSGGNQWSTQNLRGVRKGPRTTAHAGSSMVLAGDVNGDGLADVLVGAPSASSRFRQEGAVLVYQGSTNGLPMEPDRTLWGRSAGVHFGSAVAAAGDVNRDGFDDVLVGAPEDSSAAPYGGRVDLFLGSSNGLSATPAWSFAGRMPSASVGAALAGLGDVNGDQFPDVIVGAPGTDKLSSEWPGAALVFQGSPGGLSAEPTMALQGEFPMGMFGASFASRGDVNGDGRADVLIGAPKISAAAVGAGRVYLFPGLTGGLSCSPSWVLDGTSEAGNIGTTLAFVPDANGDGCDEIVMAAPNDSSLTKRAGRVDVLWGSRTNYLAAGFRPRLTPLQEDDSSSAPSRPWWSSWTTVGSLLLGGLAVAWAIATRRRVVESERSRLAREFHDDLGAELNHISLLADLVRRESPTDPGRKERAEQLASATREVLERMEQVIWSVNPACDNLEDLVGFILQYAGPFLAPSGIELHPEVPATIPRRSLSPEVRRNVFLCVKEALNNVSKHAQASQVRLRVQCQPDSFIIEITDDGRGLPPGATAESRWAGTADGLGNLAARMREVRGRLDIDCQPGGGTRLTFTVPH